MKPRGFTLAEMLVVMAVIATLAAVAVPLARSVVGRSREAACLNQLRGLGVGLEAYLQDHQQKLPDLEAGRGSRTSESPVLETVLLPYVGGPDSFRCPQDKSEFANTGSSYLWNSTQSGLPFSNLSFFGNTDRPDKIPLITDKESWHPSGTNFLYADQTSSSRIRFATGSR